MQPREHVPRDRARTERPGRERPGARSTPSSAADKGERHEQAMVLLVGAAIAALACVTLLRAATSFTPDLQPVGYIGQLEVTIYVLTSGHEVVFETDYDRNTWTGNVHAYPVDAAGVVALQADWWNDGAASDIDAQDPNTGRIIVTDDGKSNATGKPFRWASLSGAQQNLLGTSTTGPQVLNFVRGDQSLEKANGGTFRDRTSVLGDILHSRPYYLPDPNGEVLFVGANDGMLHAIDARTDGRRRGTVGLCAAHAAWQAAQPGREPVCADPLRRRRTDHRPPPRYPVCGRTCWSAPWAPAAVASSPSTSPTRTQPPRRRLPPTCSGKSATRLPAFTPNLGYTSPQHAGHRQSQLQRLRRHRAGRGHHGQRLQQRRRFVPVRPGPAGWLPGPGGHHLRGGRRRPVHARLHRREQRPARRLLLCGRHRRPPLEIRPDLQHPEQLDFQPCCTPLPHPGHHVGARRGLAPLWRVHGQLCHRAPVHQHGPDGHECVLRLRHLGRRAGGEHRAAAADGERAHLREQ